MTDSRSLGMEDIALIDRVAAALETLRYQWLHADSGPMPTYHEAAEMIVRCCATPESENREP